ncbi:MAG TPA: hypothetical protein PKO15_08575 [Fibrobacteria bacterium]|nr:hypothetical protein [Fibrobacteria bacterium]HOX50270.1 hypothetical protein [Fibrobacteria bacterium]
MNLTPGPCYRTDVGFAPNHLGANIWFHLKPDLVGVMGMEFSSWSPDRTTSLGIGQYTGAFSWIFPNKDSLQTLDLSLRLGGETQSAILDTMRHTPPRTSVSWDWQMGLRAGYARQDGRIGSWVSWGPLFSWRTSGEATGLRWVLETETGLTVDLRDIFVGSRSATRTWNLVIRVPVRFDPIAPRLGRDDNIEEAQWSWALLVGPSVLF